MLHRHSLLQCTLALFTSAALVLTMSACDTVNSFSNSEDDPDLELGRFEMTLSGAIDGTYEGLAVFSTTTIEDSTGEEHDVFGLAFMPDTTETEVNRNSWFLSEIIRASTRPDEGEYEFDAIDGQHLPDSPLDFPDDPFILGFQTEDTTRFAAMTSDAGTLTFTTSSSSRMAGTFSVESSGAYNVYDEMEKPQNGSITIEGSFNAIGGQLPDQN